MFRCKACQAKDSEIKHLREMLSDMHDRFMSYSSNAMMTYELKQDHDKNAIEEIGLAVMDKIESIPVLNEKDQKDKEAAKKQMMDILGN